MNPATNNQPIRTDCVTPATNLLIPIRSTYALNRTESSTSRAANSVTTVKMETRSMPLSQFLCYALDVHLSVFSFFISPLQNRANKDRASPESTRDVRGLDPKARQSEKRRDRRPDAREDRKSSSHPRGSPLRPEGRDSSRHSDNRNNKISLVGESGNSAVQNCRRSDDRYGKKDSKKVKTRDDSKSDAKDDKSHVAKKSGAGSNKGPLIRKSDTRDNKPATRKSDTRDNKGPLIRKSETRENKGSLTRKSDTRESKGSLTRKSETRDKGPLIRKSVTRDSKPLARKSATREDKKTFIRRSGTRDEKGPKGRKSDARDNIRKSITRNGKTTLTKDSRNTSGRVQVRSNRPLAVGRAARSKKADPHPSSKSMNTPNAKASGSRKLKVFVMTCFGVFVSIRCCCY